MVTPPPVTVGTPLAVRGARLRNRVVGAPMERNYCDLSGRPTQQYVDYLEARAAGGAALLFTESSYVSQTSQARPHQMGMHADHVLPGLARVADAVHRHGALLGVELNHAGRVVPSAVSQLQPVGPSAVPCAEIGGEVPRALSISEIDEIVVQFATAAARAVRGGADVLSVHGAHGYLIAQFLSPRSNVRDDEYGAPTAFLNRVLASVRDAAGPSVPVFLRLSAFEGLPGGLDTEASFALLDDIDLHHVDVLDVSAGTYGAGQWITPSGEVPEGYLADVARRYRERTGLLVSLAGRITRPETARSLVDSGATDLVCAARALHADARWARHVLAGTSPRPCISCNQGCADVIFTGQPLWCAANPATGREGRASTGGARPRGVLPGTRAAVVGAGPAGLEAAVALAEAGLDVQLLDDRSGLGGQFAQSAGLRAKPQFGRLLDWYEHRLHELGVEVVLERRASLDDLATASVAVVATGGVDHRPEVPGLSAPRVVGLREWLRTGARTPGEPFVVWGADRAGVYVADELAGAGHPVTVVGAQATLAPDGGAREKLPAVERLTTSPLVTLHLGCSLEAVLDDAVVLARGGVRTTVAAAGRLLVSQGTVPATEPGGPWESLDGPLVLEVVHDTDGATFDGALRAGRSAAERALTALGPAERSLPAGAGAVS